MKEVVHRILRALNDAGFEAYVVGGAVRDLLMHKEPHDYDITTSARPEEIMAVAAKQNWKSVDVNGKTFGVVVLVIGGETYEVASFRGEVYGEDSHRPERVWYAASLREDVMRRDFTINALAMDAAGQVYDYVGGRKDIRKRRLAAVGNAKERFQEDALRLFRLCRFAGQLDFLPEKKTQDAMPQAFGRVVGLSSDRVVAEIERLLVTPAAYKGLDILVRSGLGNCSCRRKENGEYVNIPIMPEFSHLPDTPQSPPFHVFDAWIHTLAVISYTPADLTLRYAALFHDVAKGSAGIRGIRDGRYTDYGHDRAGARITAEVMTRWRRNKACIRRVAWLVKTHMKFHYFANTGQGNVVKWLRHEAGSNDFHSTAELAAAVRQATALAVADAKGCRPDANTDGTVSFGQYMEELAGSMPVGTGDLQYDRRVPEICGSRTGDCLRVLLKRVQDGTLANEPDVFAAAAERWMKRRST